MFGAKLILKKLWTPQWQPIRVDSAPLGTEGLRWRECILSINLAQQLGLPVSVSVTRSIWPSSFQQWFWETQSRTAQSVSFIEQEEVRATRRSMMTPLSNRTEIGINANSFRSIFIRSGPLFLLNENHWGHVLLKICCTEWLLFCSAEAPTYDVIWLACDWRNSCPIFWQIGFWKILSGLRHFLWTLSQTDLWNILNAPSVVSG